MTESVCTLIDTVLATRRRLAAVSVTGTPRATQAACDLGRSLSMELADLLDDLAGESPAAQATARAAGERFDSHVLAATMLEASDASPVSVFELVARGLDRLNADLQRLARSRRLPA